MNTNNYAYTSFVLLIKYSYHNYFERVNQLPPSIVDSILYDSRNLIRFLSAVAVLDSLPILQHRDGYDFFFSDHLST